VARRAAAIDEERKADSLLLLVSAGNFYDRPGILQKYRNEFLSNMMVRMDYSAVALGNRELQGPIRAIQEDAERGLPVVCSNLYSGGELLFPARVITEIRGRRIGIFALIGSDAPAGEGLEIRDPSTEGSAQIEELRSLGCDLVVLLANMRKSELITLLPQFGGVDLVVRGHADKGVKVGEDCADTLGGDFEDPGIPIFYAGDRGRAMGKLLVDVHGTELPVSVRGELLYLDSSTGADRDVEIALAEFAAAQGVRRRELQLSEFLARNELTGKVRERYLGVETCRRCHVDMMPEFVLSRHFRAMETLRIRGEENNRSCVGCHSTGFGRFTGYDPKSAGTEGAPDLAGVQCEACHGQGTTHARDGTYVEAATKSCRACHTAKWSPDFDFDEYWARSRHCGVKESKAGNDEGKKK
jgi:hypothetical protein